MNRASDPRAPTRRSARQSPSAGTPPGPRRAGWSVRLSTPPTWLPARSHADVSKSRLRILMQTSASPFVISNAVRDTWLSAGIHPLHPGCRLQPW